MASNNRIDLYLHELGNKTTSVTGESNTASQQLSKNDSVAVAEAKSVTKGMMVASTIASGAFRYVASNVGKYTGNSAYQTTVNNAQTLFETGAMFLVNPLLGAANVGMQLATTAIDENFRRKQESVSLAQARARAGYTTDAASYRKR
jgi:hypothetical protein